MYELKKMERYLRVNLLGPGPRLMKKKKLPGRSVTKVEEHWSTQTGENQLQYYEQELLHERSGHTFTHPVLL